MIKSQSKVIKKLRLFSFVKENRSFILFIVLMSIFRSAVADWNDIPSASMEPTILTGDRVFINKMAYDVRVPFTQHPIKKLADPERGDIIVFESAVSAKRLIKRVVAVPGDRVAMRNNVLFVNGQQLVYKPLQHLGNSIEVEENLVGVEHAIRVSQYPTAQSSFDEFSVPDGYFFALGDNRDNSHDSRMIGLVPRDEIIGRSNYVAFSLDYDRYFLPRRDRFFRKI